MRAHIISFKFENIFQVNLTTYWEIYVVASKIVEFTRHRSQNIKLAIFQ